MRVVLTDDLIEVRLALWERVLGLLGNIRVRREHVGEVHLVDDPLRETMMSGGLKVGLRLPWLLYVARNVRLDHAYVVRRGIPGISFTVTDGGRITNVLASTREASQIARSLTGG